MICKSVIEDSTHLFVLCALANLMWNWWCKEWKMQSAKSGRPLRAIEHNDRRGVCEEGLDRCVLCNNMVNLEGEKR